MQAPVVVTPIPAQMINELAAYGPFDLKPYIKSPDEEQHLRFSAELKSGQALPKGMICTSDGILTGIPAKGTQGHYELIITAANDVGSVQATFVLTVKPSLANSETDYIDQLKAQIWQALEQRLPIPDLPELYNRPVTALDIYYLLERWGVLKIWDAFNLEAPGDMVPLHLEGASEHYVVYDRGSCIVACPKDLFSSERTLEDGLQTARAVAQEVYRRQWTIELAGFDKLVRSAWVELQHLGDQHGKQLEIINFDPAINDVKLYSTQAQEIRMTGLE